LTLNKCLVQLRGWHPHMEIKSEHVTVMGTLLVVNAQKKHKRLLIGGIYPLTRGGLIRVKITRTRIALVPLGKKANPLGLPIGSVLVVRAQFLDHLVVQAKD